MSTIFSQYFHNKFYVVSLYWFNFHTKKVYIGSNLNPLLKLHFCAFVITSNNQTLKICYESIVKM